MEKKIIFYDKDIQIEKELSLFELQLNQKEGNKSKVAIRRINKKTEKLWKKLGPIIYEGCKIFEKKIIKERNQEHTNKCGNRSGFPTFYAIQIFR